MTAAEDDVWGRPADESDEAAWGKPIEHEPPTTLGRLERKPGTIAEEIARPITSLPETWRGLTDEAKAELLHGVQALREPTGGDLLGSASATARGLAGLAGGAYNYFTAMPRAAYRSFLSRPLEETTGLPKEYTEFAGELAVPGIGFTRLPRAVRPIVPTELPGLPAQEAAKEFGVQLNRAQATQDPTLFQTAEAARRGAFGEEATNIARGATQGQFEDIQAANRGIQQKLAGERSLMPTSSEAAQALREELAPAAARERAAVEAAEGRSQAAIEAAEQGAAAEQAGVRAALEAQGEQIAARARGNQPAMEVPQRELGEIIGPGVRQAATREREAASEAYTALTRRPGEFYDEPFHNIGQHIEHNIGGGSNPVIIDPATTPQSRHAIGYMNTRPNFNIDAATGPVDLRGVVQVRNGLNTFYANARRSNNLPDVRAMGRIINEYDNLVEKFVSDGLFTGDPGFLNAWQAARGQFAAYARRYRPQFAGDEVGLAMRRIIDRNAAPEEIANMLTGYGRIGSRGLPADIARRLEQVFGRDSPQMNAIGDAMWQKAQVRNAAGEIDAVRTARSIDDLVGSRLGEQLYSPELRTAMTNHASGIREIDNIVAGLPSVERAAEIRGAMGQRITEARSAFEQAFGGADIGGTPGTIFRRIMDGTAKPEDIVSGLFRIINKDNLGNAARFIDAVKKISGPQGPAMDAMRQGTWQQLTTGFGADKQGIQAMSSALKMLTDGKAKGIAAQLYAPEEIAMMRRFRENVLEKAITPQGLTSTSGTSYQQAFINNKALEIGAGIAGKWLGKGVSAVTGLPGGTLAGSAAAKAGVRKFAKSAKSKQTEEEIRELFSPIPPPGPIVVPGPQVGRGLPPAALSATPDQGFKRGGAVNPRYNLKYHVPTGAIASKKHAGLVYIDPAIPPKFRPFLHTHEMAEKRAMEGGKSYEKAHEEDATPAERAQVERAGLDWTKYTHEMDGYLDHIEHRGSKRLPPDPHVPFATAMKVHRHV